MYAQNPLRVQLKYIIIHMIIERGNENAFIRISKKCNDRNVTRTECEQCAGCTYGANCPHDCATCLQYIHFPDRAPERRQYDCTHMADYYYCKYSFRYASEIVYGLRQIADIKDKRNLKVMSVGCGPCTELAAIDYLRQRGELQYDTLEFHGIDPLSQVWDNIWKDIKDYFGGGIEFYPNDVLDLVDIIIKKQWIPDVIIFQYVFSDMYKNNTQKDIEEFIEKLACFLDEQTDKSIYILANDINLSTSYGGGRDFFDILKDKMHASKIVKKFHFDNLSKESHFNYGEEYLSNELIFDIDSKEIDSEEIAETYEPFDSCASAQILITKLEE